MRDRFAPQRSALSAARSAQRARCSARCVAIPTHSWQHKLTFPAARASLALGDQDILNVLFYDSPSLLHLLPSRWNTLQPAGRIRVSAPNFVPMPPCVLHFSAESYAAGKDANRLGNGAFRFVADWEA